jgi:hypothetical protein
MNTTKASTRFIHHTILSTTAAIFIACAFAATGVAQSEITDLAVLNTGPEKVAPNADITFQITVSNIGPDNAGF